MPSNQCPVVLKDRRAPGLAGSDRIPADPLERGAAEPGTGSENVSSSRACPPPAGAARWFGCGGRGLHGGNSRFASRSPRIFLKWSGDWPFLGMMT